MMLTPGIRERRYRPAPPYEVSQAKINEFADAVGDTQPACRDPESARALGHPTVIAPPTFVFLLVHRAMDAVFIDPTLGIGPDGVVHGEQAFVFVRPIRAGDRLVVTIVVESTRVIGGVGVLMTRGEVATEAGEPVATTRSTLIVRTPKAVDERTRTGE